MAMLIFSMARTAALRAGFITDRGGGANMSTESACRCHVFTALRMVTTDEASRAGGSRTTSKYTMNCSSTVWGQGSKSVSRRRARSKKLPSQVRRLLDYGEDDASDVA